MMENWAREPAVIAEYAKHYETGKSMPLDLLDKISKAGQFNQGFATTEYVAASYLDMAWHSQEEKVSDANQFEKET